MKQDISTSVNSPSLSLKARIGFIVFGILLACAMLEVGLRVVGAIQARQARVEANAAQTPEGEFWATYDPDLGYRLNPKFGDNNPDGLRDRPVGPKGDGQRILFLGDSVAYYGDTVDDTFVGHLRDELHKNPSFEKVDVIDAGMKGYTDYQELLYLKKYGLKFQPDVVAVEFCLNDLHKFEHSFTIENGQLVPGSYDFSQEAYTASDHRSWLRRQWDKSRLLTTLESAWNVALKGLAWKVDNGYSFDYAVDVGTAWLDDPWKDIDSQFQELVQLSHQYNFKLMVVVFPIGAQYNANYLARDRAYVLKPQTKLKEITQRLNIPFYDLYPDLNAKSFDDGIHLTKDGRQFVGKRLAEVFAQSQLLAAGTPSKP